jgi:hypothetical protein
MPGTSALLLRRFDGLDWCVLFDSDSEAKPNEKGERRDLAAIIDPLVHQEAKGVRSWTKQDLFNKYIELSII